ncbi:MAG: DUF1192 domain-containing protein [Cucumibacter sp.]
MDDEDAQRRPKPHEIGMKLDTLSVDELNERIRQLEVEIARLKAAIRHKSASRDAAEVFFRR